jgi:diadenosine tetraphosphatase ApaH/serine/threonine PP2A family protein phosphatase
VKYLVISDIHANLEALEATLQVAGPYDQALVLGDLVGYGADPNAVIDRVRTLPTAAIIRGNHDKVASGLDSVESFNYLARQAIEWTAAALTPKNKVWLAALPQGPVLIDKFTEICHGTPFDEDMYVFEEMDAVRALKATRRPLCLFGHTHVPAMFTLGEAPPESGMPPPPGTMQLDVTVPVQGSPFQIDLSAPLQYLVNCGAVGQPRDGDSRAAYGMLDTDARTLTIMRTVYDLATAQAKIVDAGLPEVLAQRLGVGR